MEVPHGGVSEGTDHATAGLSFPRTRAEMPKMHGMPVRRRTVFKRGWDMKVIFFLKIGPVRPIHVPEDRILSQKKRVLSHFGD